MDSAAWHSKKKPTRSSSIVDSRVWFMAKARNSVAGLIARIILFSRLPIRGHAESHTQMTVPESPLAEPAAEPVGLDRFFGDEPESFSAAELEALVAGQRAERDRRIAAKSKRRESKSKSAVAAEE
jgi:hypothetical protein